MKNTTKKTKKILILTLIISLSLTNCKPNSLAKNKKNNPPSNPYWNNMVKFLAGMDVPKNSSFAKKTKTAYWKDHKNKMDAYWKEVEVQTLNPIKKWVKNNIIKSDPKLTVFYPLSGADFLNSYLFYPDSQNYLLTALEDTGPIPEPLKLNDKQLEQGLKALRQVISRYGVFNYFTSKGMGEKMANKYFSGTMPIFLILLARLGFNVDSIAQVDLNEKGELLTRKKGTIKKKQNSIDTSSPTKKAKGLKILFHSTNKLGKRINRKLVYFNWRLSNEMVAGKNPVALFLNKNKEYYTFMKSAVYLLQMNSFVGLKNYVLSKSKWMIQDDSGIAYRDFNNKDWTIKLFGEYVPFPIKGCIYEPQAELKSAFTSSTPSLPFHFGYGSMRGKHKSNIMFAVRKK